MSLSSTQKWFLRVSMVIYLALTLLSWSFVPRSVDPPFIFHSFPSGVNKNPLEDLSSVDYYACCGLGHRLIRMSLAAYVARQLNFSLRVFWGWCGEKKQVEVFSYLFRPYLASEVEHVRSRDLLLPFYNEVPGFAALERRPVQNLIECPCHPDKIESDYNLYSSLRDRFRDRALVDSFIEENFANATVLGIHVRAGNGEVGDFVRKGRNIENPQQWVNHVGSLLEDFILKVGPLPRPPVLYVATDTPSMIRLFRSRLAVSNIAVLELPIRGRLEEGEGVLFGEAAKVHNKGEGDGDDFSSCLRDWSDTMMDMFLLSHADVVIAGKPSSFSQTLPMSLAFGNTKRRLKPAYCEVIPQFESSKVNASSNLMWREVSPTMKCYVTYTEWCCNFSTWNKFYHNGPNGQTKIMSKEMVKFVQPGKFGIVQNYPAMRNRTENCPRPRRGRAGGGLRDKCLPHVW